MYLDVSKIKKEFKIFRYSGLQDYNEILNAMREKHLAVVQKLDVEQIWFLEHNHVYTAGGAVSESDFLDISQKINDIDTDYFSQISLHKVERGGLITYHGPGQMIYYIMANVRTFCDDTIDIRKFNKIIADPAISAISEYGLDAYLSQDPIGVYVRFNSTEKKIGSIGVAIRNGISLHGIAINVGTNMDYFSRINPCGMNYKYMSSINRITNNSISVQDMIKSTSAIFKNSLSDKYNITLIDL